MSSIMDEYYEEGVGPMFWVQCAGCEAIFATDTPSANPGAEFCSACLQDLVDLVPVRGSTDESNS